MSKFKQVLLVVCTGVVLSTLVQGFTLFMPGGSVSDKHCNNVEECVYFEIEVKH